MEFEEKMTLKITKQTKIQYNGILHEIRDFECPIGPTIYAGMYVCIYVFRYE
jgi:hypothetical protein